MGLCRSHVRGVRLRIPRFRRSGPNPGEACRIGRRAATGLARRHTPATRLCRQGPERRRRAGSGRRATPAIPAAYLLRDRQARKPYPLFSSSPEPRRTGRTRPRVSGRAVQPTSSGPVCAIEAAAAGKGIVIEVGKPNPMKDREVFVAADGRQLHRYTMHFEGCEGSLPAAARRIAGGGERAGQR